MSDRVEYELIIEDDPSKPERGRKVLAIPVLLAAGAVALFGAFELGRRNNGHLVNEHISTTERIYRSGQSIDIVPGVRVDVRGWDVVVPKSAEPPILNGLPEEVKMQLLAAGSPEVPEVDISSDGFSGGMSVESEPGNPDSYIMPTIPDSAGDTVSLVVTREIEKFDGKTIKDTPIGTKIFTIKPTIYHEQLSEKDKKNSASPIVNSEANLGKAQLDKLASTAHLFDSFIDTPIYVYNSIDQLSRGGDYDSTDDRAEMSSLSFTDPLFKDNELAIGFHELSHAMLQRQIDLENDEVPVTKMIEAYRGLARAGGFRLPIEISGLLGPGPELESSPVFAIFDESYYVDQAKIKQMEKKGDSYGHPYSNFNELFASAMTVVHFFPEQFIHRYGSLAPRQQIAVKNVVGALDTIIHSFPYASKRDIAKLQPHLADILDKI